MTEEPAEPTRWFFVHVQKTAGTSLNRALKRMFGREAIYPDETDGDPVARVISVAHLLARWHARRDQVRVVTGHFPLCTADLLGVPLRTFTVLRDPVERTLSYLRHHRKTTPADADKPLEAIYDDPFRFHGLVHNHMVKMFSLTVDEMTDGLLTRVDFTPEHLERAKKRLGAVDVVGLQDDLPALCAALRASFGWRFQGLDHVNRTQPVAVARSFRERIARDNMLDVELYEFAKDLVAARSSDGRLRQG